MNQVESYGQIQTTELYLLKRNFLENVPKKLQEYDEYAVWDGWSVMEE